MCGPRSSLRCCHIRIIHHHPPIIITTDFKLRRFCLHSILTHTCNPAGAHHFDIGVTRVRILTQARTATHTDCVARTMKKPFYTDAELPCPLAKCFQTVSNVSEAKYERRSERNGCRHKLCCRTRAFPQFMSFVAANGFVLLLLTSNE